MFFFLRGVALFAVLLLISPGAIAQSGPELLDEFNRGLMVNFIGPMRSAGVQVTPELRAKCIGYQLHRHKSLAGNYIYDRQCIDKLTTELKTFITSVGGQASWSIVQNGVRGDYDMEIEGLLGGSVYVAPIFTSLDDIERQRKRVQYSEQQFYKIKDHRNIISI
jgi:hypothetical protein